MNFRLTQTTTVDTVVAAVQLMAPPDKLRLFRVVNTIGRYDVYIALCNNITLWRDALTELFIHALNVGDPRFVELFLKNNPIEPTVATRPAWATFYNQYYRSLAHPRSIPKEYELLGVALYNPERQVVDALLASGVAVLPNTIKALAKAGLTECLQPWLERQVTVDYDTAVAVLQYATNVTVRALVLERWALTATAGPTAGAVLNRHMSPTEAPALIRNPAWQVVYGQLTDELKRHVYHALGY